MKRALIALMILLLSASAASAQVLIDSGTIDSGTDNIDFNVPIGTISLNIEVTGTFVGTLEVLTSSRDNVVPVFIQRVFNGETGALVPTITAPGSYALGNTGFVRVRIAPDGGAWTSGAAEVRVIRGFGTPPASGSGGGTTDGALESTQEEVRTAVQNLDDVVLNDGINLSGIAGAPPGLNNTWPVTLIANGAEVNLTASASTYYTTSAASNNATSVKASPGNVFLISAVNTTATIYYLRLYNLATAPTCSSATGFLESIPIPASTSGGGIVRPSLAGKAFNTGIAFCITGGGANNDNTNAATGVYVTFEYE